MSADQKYFHWEFASIGLELNPGIQLQLSKEERLLKYHFLALPGTKAPTIEGRQYNDDKIKILFT